MPSTSPKAFTIVAVIAVLAAVGIVLTVLISPGGTSTTVRSEAPPTSTTPTSTTPTSTTPTSTAAPTTISPTTTSPATVVADPATQAPPSEPVPAAPMVAAPSGLMATGPVLASGSDGAEVALVQLVLGRRGYWVAEKLGRFGEGTRHALAAFQKYSALPRTGKLDFWTRIALSGPVERVSPLRPGTGHRIDVDLARQVMVIATDDTVDGVFDISSGKRSTPTPKGAFRLEREIRGRRVAELGVLISPKYFKGGYAIHGSPSVPSHAASHGCVRVTNQTIAYLWESGLIPLGTPITIY